jgi:hypothetical protein
MAMGRIYPRHQQVHSRTSVFAPPGTGMRQMMQRAANQSQSIVQALEPVTEAPASIFGEDDLSGVLTADELRAARSLADEN